MDRIKELDKVIYEATVQALEAAEERFQIDKIPPWSGDPVPSPKMMVWQCLTRFMERRAYFNSRSVKMPPLTQEAATMTSREFIKYTKKLIKKLGGEKKVEWRIVGEG
ncbi:MAG: hypothetical protein PVF83_12475 [Anaerolineales bacterium]|jgi:hypothetical protein